MTLQASTADIRLPTHTVTVTVIVLVMVMVVVIVIVMVIVDHCCTAKACICPRSKVSDLIDLVDLIEMRKTDCFRQTSIVLHVPSSS